MKSERCNPRRGDGAERQWLYSAVYVIHDTEPEDYVYELPGDTPAMAYDWYSGLEEAVREGVEELQSQRDEGLPWEMDPPDGPDGSRSEGEGGGMHDV